MKKKKKAYSIYQPVEEYYYETTEHLPKTIQHVEHLIAQLREEEDYYPGEEYQTKLMITRLRKIFYDQWGWSSEVIRGAASIPGRYEVTMVKDPAAFVLKKKRGRNMRDDSYDYVGLVPVVVYSKHDRQYPERAGQVPEIYKNDNQEVILPEGFVCDIGHILSGMDAMNYPAPVTPLRGILYPLYKVTPHVTSNVDFATWLGDLASTVGNFLFKKLQDANAGETEEEEEIEIYSPASDMLGNVDAYVIASVYGSNENSRVRFSDMLKDYYFEKGIGEYARNHRCTLFCKIVGLKNWNNGVFENETQWIRKQKKELRIATAFYVFGDLHTIKGFFIAIAIWLRFFDRKMQLETLLYAFLQTLKKEIELEGKESKTN